MFALSKGKYRVRLAANHQDVQKAQALRHLAFFGSAGLDQDEWDASCDHILIEDRKSDILLGCFRMLELQNGQAVDQSYSAQFYDLAALRNFDGPMVEMGRFCIAPDVTDPDLLRIAWGAMAQYVETRGIELLFGFSSFQGTDTAQYSDAFAILRDRHLAPKRWLPRIKAPKVIPFADLLRRADAKRGMRVMPPLLKTYLMMGGWVSDHAVIDRKMNTLHVFTGVEIRSIPPARKRLLRAIAAGAA